MRVSALVIAFVFSLFFLSCKEEKKEPNNNVQMKEVMAVHDELMPKMGKIGRLVGKLNKLEDSTETGQLYKEAKIDLQEANKAMMDWMRELGDRFDYEEIMKGKELTEQKQLWLNEEQDKVKELKEKINGSIERAEKLLENNNQQHSPLDN
ncbi:hypothetical protein SB49_13500 [Sediminicola sp. YIK13]|uniref:hypothetical protein n=1 Tax=Sediminicola sp. YIK13 TaxID=1453352 RepID=UPI00071FA538|nr:hypothetical protein [Sediminicola sp. YIK13]ALM08710.1 hypothetical protein SB49_13500 [Sediminicola sp. YIK13]